MKSDFILPALDHIDDKKDGFLVNLAYTKFVFHNNRTDMGSGSWRCNQTERHQFNRKFSNPLFSFSLTALKVHMLQSDLQEQSK